MISRITSILAAGAAALVLVAIPAQALTPAQTKKKIATLKKQLNALPKHKAPFAKINSLVTQLTKLDGPHATNWLNTGLTKISITNAKKNATTLTNNVNKLVNSNKKIKPAQKKSIQNKNKALLKKYVPPGPKNPPYQAMVVSDSPVLG